MKKATLHLIIIKKTRAVIYFTIFVLIFLAIFFAIGKNDARYVFNTNSAEYNTVMKRDLLCLMVSYWQYAKGVQQASDGKVYLVMQSGARILYDDKKAKTSDEKFNNADLQDMLEQIYPLYSPNYLRSIDFNPGRNRVYKLFNEVYGKTKAKIEDNLVSAGFGKQVLKFNNRNNAAASLKKVDSELTVLVRTHSNVSPYIYPSSGTFNYRNIAGTSLPSAHSFGTAIDLAANRKDYWQWTSRLEVQKRMALYPSEVVKIFERNNYIWGGRWGYFDLMHYEYRPELIYKAKYFSKMPGQGQPWYTGSPYPEDANVRNYVRMINAAIK